MSAQRSIITISSKFTKSGVKCNRNETVERRVEELQRHRQRHLQAACQNYSRVDVKSKKAYNHFLVDDHHQVIYCWIPKAGCTNWKRMMVRLSGRYHGNPNHRIHVHTGGTKNYGLRALNSYNWPNITKRLKTYKKFLFVRNPFERLLSGYKNKFLEKEWYFILKFGPAIKRMFRGSAKAKGRVRFEEFVRWLPRLYNRDGYFDEHWKHYYRLCRPCDIDYDFIGKMETMAEDSDYIIRHLYGRQCPPALPQKPGGHKTTDRVTSTYYSNLSTHVIENLYEAYKRDFVLFDYNREPPSL